MHHIVYEFYFYDLFILMQGTWFYLSAFPTWLFMNIFSYDATYAYLNFPWEFERMICSWFQNKQKIHFVHHVRS